MATLKDFRDERLRKLKDLRDLGINPYPADSHRTHNSAEIISKFNDLENQVVTIAGRITSIRKFGKLAFIVVKDFSGQIQFFLRSDIVAGLDVANNQLGWTRVTL